MGDISEMRGLIVLFTIIALTISLVVLMPSEFFTPSGVDEKYLPDPDTLQLIAWNNTLTLNVTYTLGDVERHSFDLNGYHVFLDVYGTDDNEVPFSMTTYASWWIFAWDYDYFDYYDNVSQLVSEDFQWLGYTYPALYSDTVDGYDAPQIFECKNTKTAFQVTVVYNTTAYGNYTEALKDDAASLVFYVDWEDRASSFNALSLVSMVLTGSLPSIDPALSVVFGVIGWGLVAAGVYLAFIFVLRIVGAVFGGGGA